MTAAPIARVADSKCGARRHSQGLKILLIAWCATFPIWVGLTLELIWEQTLLTWEHGEQMIGFTLAHTLGIIVFPAVFAHFASWLGVLTFLLVPVLRKQTSSPWVLVLCVVLSCAPVPAYMLSYGDWQRLTLERKGLGPRAGNQLLYRTAAGDVKTVEALMNLGLHPDAAPNAEDCDRALLMASRNGSKVLVELLLSRGANPEPPPCRGQTPARVGTPEIREILRLRGVEPWPTR